MPEPTSNTLRDDRREIVAFLGALCLFLSAVEYLVPKPVPFFRLGLANLPILLGLSFLRPVDLMMVVLLKVLGQGLVNGTLASYVFLFSLAGSVASALAMVGVHRWGGRFISLIGVSLFGALASSVVQVLFSVVFVFGSTARIIAPFFLISGSVTGLFIGVFAQRFTAKSRWFGLLKQRYAGDGLAE